MMGVDEPRRGCGKQMKEHTGLGVKVTFSSWTYIYTCISRLQQDDKRHFQAAVPLAPSGRCVPVLTHGFVAMKRLEAEIGNRRLWRLVVYVEFEVDGPSRSRWGLPWVEDFHNRQVGRGPPPLSGHLGCRSSNPSAHLAPQQTATPIVSSSCELLISNAPHIPPPSTVLLSKSAPTTVVRLYKTNNNPRPDLWSLLSSTTTPPPPTTISKLPDRSYPHTSSSQDGWCSSTRRLL